MVEPVVPPGELWWYGLREDSGAAVESLGNVVAWELPRGEALVNQGSVL